MSKESSSRREAIIRKVRALLSKTVDNGTTEQEALAAAAKAAELMAAYDLEMSELDARDAGVAEEKYPLHPTFAKHMVVVSMAISELCGVRSWSNTSRAGTREARTFFGLPHDVEVALYLAEICERAMGSEVTKASAAWALFNPRKRSVHSDSFLMGMADRLSERISELAWARRRATGSALVPLKDAIIEKAMADRGIELTNARLGRRDIDPMAFVAGLAAGNKVPLNAAVGEAAKAGQVLEGTRDGEESALEPTDQ